MHVNQNIGSGYYRVTSKSDIPYISHEGNSVESESDTVKYYYTRINTNVKIQPNPSYNINAFEKTIESSGDHYYCVDNPSQGAVSPTSSTDNIYDDVSGSHEYLAVT